MIVWFIILFLNGIDGLPDGAPKSACSSLMPVHSGYTPQTSKAPYEIRAELSDQKVIVRISSPTDEKFDGFILQARSSKDPSKFIDGEFPVGQTFKTIDCFGSKKNTLTHVNRNSKYNIMTEWVPKESIEDEVIFRGTIAKKFDTFWDKVDSNPVKPMDPIPGVSDSSAKGLEYCIKEEDCIGLPDNCVERRDCEIILKHSKSSDGITFSLQGILEPSQYMAMGLSEDAFMGKDSVTECIYDGANPIARESWNEGKSNTRTKEVSVPMQHFTGSFVNGITACSWKLPLVAVKNGETYDFVNKVYYLLIAKGDVSEGRLKYHALRTASEALNLTESNAAEKVPDPKSDNDSPHSDSQPPQTTTTHKMGSTTGEDASSTDIFVNEVDTSCSSYLKSTCIMFLLTGFLFAAKECLNDFILKHLF